MAVPAVPARLVPLRARSLPFELFRGTNNHLPNTKIPKNQRDTIIVRRNACIYACAVQLLFGVGCLPLSGVRGRYGKAAAVINVMVTLCGLVGFDAASRVRMTSLFAHFTLVTSLELLFVGFIIVSNSIREVTADESEADSAERWVLLAFLLFGVVDLVVAAFTYRLWRALAAVRENAAALRDDAAARPLPDWRGAPPPHKRRAAAEDSPAIAVAHEPSDGSLAAGAAAISPASVPVATPIAAGETVPVDGVVVAIS